MIDYEATGLNDTLSWLGPFLACPENEVVDAFEVNFSFPNGICGFDNKGKKRIRHVEWEISIGLWHRLRVDQQAGRIRAQKH
jgi:hypothetical protein